MKCLHFNFFFFPIWCRDTLKQLLIFLYFLCLIMFNFLNFYVAYFRSLYLSNNTSQSCTLLKSSLLSPVSFSTVLHDYHTKIKYFIFAFAKFAFGNLIFIQMSVSSCVAFFFFSWLSHCVEFIV